NRVTHVTFKQLTKVDSSSTSLSTVRTVKSGLDHIVCTGTLLEKWLDFKYLTPVYLTRSENEPPIKFEECFIKEEVHDYQEPECCLGPLTPPPTKEKLGEFPNKSSLEQYENSHSKYKGVISSFCSN
ncbi:unnamed protein product, partial [Timema podura]|nr:unnamed protein product [Timema podura]